MSERTIPHGPYTEALRAYHLRLAEWLGVDPSLAFDMHDADVRCGDQSFRYLMTDVWWKSADRPLPIEVNDGRVLMALGIEGDGETVIFTNGVHLDGQETERMREAVGPRPEMFTPEERMALKGLLD